MELLKKVVRYYRQVLKDGRKDPDFFEMVRQLERASDDTPVGDSSAYALEPVRFGQVPSLAFPPTAVADVSQDPPVSVILVHFMGLTGCNGPLPLEYTDYIYQRWHNSYDSTARRFLDIINHRFIGLFYRAWKQNAIAPWLSDGLITRALGSLGGVQEKEFSGETQKAFEWSGLFGNSAKTRDGLETILNDYFDFAITVRDRVEAHHDIPGEYRCRLGRGNCSLGENLQVGGRYYTCTAKFVIGTEVSDFDDVKNLMPGGTGFGRMSELVRSYIDRPLDFDLELNIRRETLPETRLDGSLRLGCDVWLPGGSGGSVSLSLGLSRLTGHGERTGRPVAAD
ncbi:MAG: type VI secretion system baseplate subunit TssG [Victivallaceae bacterium]|nr:type VI secretion system baseplate subunit TssG [Victivallaceae bacterium]